MITVEELDGVPLLEALTIMGRRSKRGRDVPVTIQTIAICTELIKATSDNDTALVELISFRAAQQIRVGQAQDVVDYLAPLIQEGQPFANSGWLHKNYANALIALERPAEALAHLAQRMGRGGCLEGDPSAVRTCDKAIEAMETDWLARGVALAENPVSTSSPEPASRSRRSAALRSTPAL